MLRKPTKSSCLLEDIRVRFDCKQKINTKLYKQKTSHLSPYKVIFGGIRAKHSASSLKVFIRFSRYNYKIISTKLYLLKVDAHSLKGFVVPSERVALRSYTCRA